MPYEIERSDEEMRLRFQGALDSAGTEELAEALYDVELQTFGRFIVDLEQVPYMASGALGALVAAFNRLKDRGIPMELVRLTPTVHKLFLVTGLGRLIAVSERGSGAEEVIGKDDAHTDRALADARPFVRGVFDALDVPAEQGSDALERMFALLAEATDRSAVAADLRAVLTPLDLGQRMAECGSGIVQKLHDRIAPHLMGRGGLLQVRCGTGRLGATFAEGRDVQLCDVVDRNVTTLPWSAQAGDVLPFEDDAFDNVIVVDGLHRSDDADKAIREIRRVAKLRVVVVESICLNEAQRRFNVLLNWLYTVVIAGGDEGSFHYNSPKGWEWLFRDQGLRVLASVDIGLDEPLVPNYHWMYVLDV